MVREDKNDKIYLTEDEKNDAIIDEIKTYHDKGNPILVGTISVENSEVLSKKLDDLSIPHRVLNAKQNQQEAEIISQAGKEKAVTIATNMASHICGYSHSFFFSSLGNDFSFLLILFGI